jgi:hypothetical protein
MHQILIITTFLVLILAPCLTAINSGYEDSVFEDDDETC